MEMQQMLVVKANEAIAALWLNQLKTISNATGVGMDVLYACLDMQVPTEEKKKRAPPKKKVSTAQIVVTNPPVTEDQEQGVANVQVDPVTEKKKRAPPKKKQLVIVQDDASVAVSEKSVAVSDASSAAEEKKAKKEAEALEKKAKKEAEALEKAAKKDTKKAPAKKATKKEEKEEQKKPEVVSRFKEGDQVRYLRPTGKTVDAVVEYVIKYDDYVEYKLQVIGKNETILSREETTFTLDQIPNDPEEESDVEDEDDADTAMVPVSPPSIPKKQTKRPDVFLKNTMNVERVSINGTSYLIGDNDTAFLESSKKMVGKYDQTDHSIRQLYSSEYDEYYGTNSDGEESDEDECPNISDMSDSDSDSGSESD